MSVTSTDRAVRDDVESGGIVADMPTPPERWDTAAVAIPGGHVMQSAAWAAYRASQGVEPRFLTFDDGHVILMLLQRSPFMPGVAAIARRGPAQPVDPVMASVDHARALMAWSKAQGARDLYLDPERDLDPAYESAMDAAGFEVTVGYDPSIHVMRLELDPGHDEDQLLTSFSKSTRQRIHGAERAGTVVLDDVAGERLEAFVVLMRERAAALGIPLQRGSHYLRGWRALLDAGLARLLIAEHDGDLVGGLFLFRHGGIHATAFSADHAASRRALPGTMHLVRWTAIRDALREGASAIELGGVDLPGHRGLPGPGEPTYGLYEHKRGFGARWVERAPPRRVVLRVGADRLAQGRRRLVEAVRSVRS